MNTDSKKSCARWIAFLARHGGWCGVFLALAPFSAAQAPIDVDPIGNEAVYSGRHTPGTLEDSFEGGEVPPEYANDLESPWEKAKLAGKLAAQGRPEQALELLLWCYDQGTDKYPEYAFALKGRLPAQIAMLGRTYQPAIDALKARGEGLKEKIAANPKRADAETASRLAAIHVATQDAPAISETLKILPKSGRATTAYGELVRPVLVAMQRYREAVDLGSPEADFGRRRAEMLRRFDELRENTRGNPTQLLATLSESTAMVGVLYVEALAGAGEVDRAQKLVRDVLKVNDSRAIRAALIRGIRRSGAGDLTDKLVPPEK